MFPESVKTGWMRKYFVCCTMKRNFLIYFTSGGSSVIVMGATGAQTKWKYIIRRREEEAKYQSWQWHSDNYQHCPQMCGFLPGANLAASLPPGRRSWGRLLQTPSLSGSAGDKRGKSVSLKSHETKKKVLVCLPTARVNQLCEWQWISLCQHCDLSGNRCTVQMGIGLFFMSRHMKWAFNVSSGLLESLHLWYHLGWQLEHLGSATSCLWYLDVVW